MSSPSSLSILRLRRCVLSLIVFASAGLLPRQAHAQNLPPDPNFQSFAFGVIVSGGTFSAPNGVVGSSGEYTLGFESPSSYMQIQLTGGSIPSGFSQNQTVDITAIDAVFLIAPQSGNNSPVNATTPGFTLSNYNIPPSTSITGWTGFGVPPASNGDPFPTYAADNKFGSGTSALIMDQDVSCANSHQEGSGSFDFENVQLNSGYTGPIYFGADVRASNGKTFVVSFPPTGGPLISTPEPQAVVLWCGMGLGLAASGYMARRRRLAGVTA